MADYTVAKIDDIEAIYGGGFKRARSALGITSFGMQVMDLPPDVDALPRARPQLRRPGGGLRDAARQRRDRDRRRAPPARRRSPRRASRPGPMRKVYAGPDGHAPADHRRRHPARPTRRSDFTEVGAPDPLAARLGEQVLGARAQQRLRAGAVLRRDEARRGRAAAPPGTRSSLPRTRSAAPAAWSATAIQVARSSRPSASRRPRQSSSALQAGEADRGLGLPVAPGAAERVGDHDRRARAGGPGDRGAQRAGARVGVRRAA